VIWPSSEADAPKRIAVVEEWTRCEESAHPASNNRASRGPTRARASAHPIRPHIHQLLGRNQVYPAPWGALIRSSCKSAGFGTRAEFVHPTPSADDLDTTHRWGSRPGRQAHP